MNRKFYDSLEKGMKSYWEGDDAVLYNTNSLEASTFRKVLKPGTVDLVIADPPSFLSDGGITCHSGRVASVDKGVWDKAPVTPEQRIKYTETWLVNVRYFLSSKGSLWVSGTSHNIFAIGIALQKLGYRIVNMITWAKPNPAPNISCKSFTASTEFLLWAVLGTENRYTFNYSDMKNVTGKQMKDVWEIPTVPLEEKMFGNVPTQKPVALYDRILDACSVEGDVVLDPFCGSGTSGVSAKKHHCGYIGIDTSSDFLDIAVKRIEKKRARTLF